MNLKRKLAIGSTALAAAAFAGGTYAATQEPGVGTRQAFLSDVAKRLHVSPAQLSAALKGAFDDQLQAAVAAGQLSQAQADTIKQRMGTSALPLPLGMGRFRFGYRPGGPARSLQSSGPFTAAAKYLGLSDTQLLGELSAGNSLAQIATARGKAIPGLKVVMTAAVRARLERARADRLITSAEEQRMLSRLEQRIQDELSESRIGPPGPVY
jgi:AraC-like DNA-binding protein